MKTSSYYPYTDDNSYHKIFDISNHVHLTSPIRIFIDTRAQWCITNNIEFDCLMKTQYKFRTFRLLKKRTNKYHKYNIDILKFCDFTFSEELNYIYSFGNTFKIINSVIAVYFDKLGFQKVKLWDSKPINANGFWIKYTAIRPIWQIAKNLEFSKVPKFQKYFWNFGKLEVFFEF